MRDASPDPIIYYLHAAALAHTQMIMAASGEMDEGIQSQLPEDLTVLLESVTPWDVAEASNKRLSQMLSGIDKWRAHPYQRSMSEPPVIWSSGHARALDYGTVDGGHPVLVVPSLINRAYILDLMEDVSFLRRMASKGLRPILLDWGSGIDPNAPQTIEDHMRDVLLPAFRHLSETSGTRPSLLGYCIGGTLATGLAAHLKDDVSKLVLMGSPWDFSELSGVAQALKTHVLETGPEQMAMSLSALGQHFGAVPAAMFQHLFAVLSPMQVVQKFSRFDQAPQNDAAAHKFVAVEDWLADAVSVPAPATKTILIDWYVENQTGMGAWNTLGTPVDPRQITAPTLVITGQKDHIVPTKVATALVPLIKNCAHLSVNKGHVGMIVGGDAQALVADRITTFLMSG